MLSEPQEEQQTAGSGARLAPQSCTAVAAVRLSCPGVMLLQHPGVQITLGNLSSIKGLK